MHRTDEYANQRIAELERELNGVQEMLAFVLKTVGEPVVVSKESINAGLDKNLQIRIDDDLQREAFIFSLGVDE